VDVLSRESTIQAAGILLAMVAFVALTAAVPSGFDSPTAAGFLVVLFYGIAFGGPNLYLYLRDEGDAIPRSARGRFLVMMGLALPLLGVSIVLEGKSLAGYNYTLIFGAVAALVFVGYFLNEARHGYAESRSALDSR
jgi:hypothetical protein